VISWWLFSQLTYSTCFNVLEVWVPCSQKLRPAAVQSSPDLRALFHYGPFWYYLPSTPRSPNQNGVLIYHIPYTCYMSTSTHSDRVNHPNSFRWTVPIMKLLDVQFSLFLRSRHSFHCLRCLSRGLERHPGHVALVLIKGKVVPVLLTKHHAMKAYWGSGCIAPHILWPRH
jgi:hypothetical protein